METDYENYTIGKKKILHFLTNFSNILVMSCVQGRRFSVEYGWIMSKNQQFRETPEYQDVVRTAVRKFGFKAETGIEAQQTDCHYDFIDYYPDGPSLPNIPDK